MEIALGARVPFPSSRASGLEEVCVGASPWRSWCYQREMEYHSAAVFITSDCSVTRDIAGLAFLCETAFGSAFPLPSSSLSSYF